MVPDGKKNSDFSEIFYELLMDKCYIGGKTYIDAKRWKAVNGALTKSSLMPWVVTKCT